jgi:nucleoside diphosphate kinase
VTRNIGPLPRAGELALLVCTPDNVSADLVGCTESLVTARTGLVPAWRFCCRVDESRLIALYGQTRAQLGRRWFTITRLFAQGPCSCAVYTESGAAAKLAMVKGATHPSRALPDTIRASLPCDNDVCNLVHVSDDADAARREIAALAGGLPDSAFTRAGQIAQPPKYPGLGHVGVVALSELLARIVGPGRSAEQPPPFPDIPTPHALFGWGQAVLRELASNSPPEARVVEAYFDGRADDVLALVRDATCVSEFEALAIECGSSAVRGWDRLPIDDALREVCRWLVGLGIDDWAIGASTALRAHGLPVSPSDIDVRCSEPVLQRVADRLARKVSRHRDMGYAANAIAVTIAGWEVELVGDLVFDHGGRVFVDQTTVARRDADGFMAPEDLFAEYLAMNRPRPRRDLERALELADLCGPRIKWEVVLSRAREFGVVEDLLDRVGRRAIIE